MSGPINWFSQIGSITKFGLLSIPQRRGTVAATVFGIAGVVAVLVGVLSIAAGFKQAMTVSGAPDAAVVLRSGADSEMVSGLGRDETRVIADSPGVAHTASGPLSSSELFVIINVPKRSTGTDANVPLRGVEASALQVRDQVKIVQGRMFDWGKNEVIVGSGAVQEFAGLEAGLDIEGGPLRLAGGRDFFRERRRGGIGNLDRRQGASGCVSSRRFVPVGLCEIEFAGRVSGVQGFADLESAAQREGRPAIRLLRRTIADHDAADHHAGFLDRVLMAVGAVFGALNTMYSAVSTRTREIATLRALGFGRGAVIVSLMIESLLLALVGGAIGGGLAYFAFNNFHTSTMNFQSFSQVTFAFRVTPELLVRGIVWAALIGLIGGLFPAIRAARLPIAAGLREL
jgi:putative ABC transport system permease protein